MDINRKKQISSVVTKLPDIRHFDSTPERHIYLLWIVTKATTLLDGRPPVLVGGGAIEFYTGIRFSTGDLDIIAPDRKLCQEALGDLGFERPPKTRHYINRTIGALVEIHSDKLNNNEQSVEVVYRKTPLYIVSPEDCLVERLLKYKKHGSTLDLLNGFLIAFHQRENIREDVLAGKMQINKLWKYYLPIQDISRALVLNEIGADEAAAELLDFMKDGARPCAF